MNNSITEGLYNNTSTQAAPSATFTPVAKEPEKTDHDIDSVAVRAHKSQRAEPHTWIELIQIPNPDNKEEQATHHYFNVNGVSYSLRFGVRIPVPQCIIENLNNAMVDYKVLGQDEQGNRITKRVRYHRVPFSQFGPATPEEVKKWKKEDLAKKEND